MRGSKIVSPTYHNVESYLADLEKRRTLEHAPMAAVFCLGDNGLLTKKVEGFPWLTRVRCELPTRPLDSQGREQPIRATYIGYCNGEDEEQWKIFVTGMHGIGIRSLKWLKLGRTSARQLAHLEESDLILIAGGDMVNTAKCFDLLVDGKHAVGERVKWRYWSGAVLVGVGSGAQLLGQKYFRPPDVWPADWEEQGMTREKVRKNQERNRKEREEREEAEEAKAKKANSSGDVEDEAEIARKKEVDAAWEKARAEEPPYEQKKAFEIVPAVLGPDLETMEIMLPAIGAGYNGFVLPPCGGIIFNTDGAFEPCQHWVHHLKYRAEAQRVASAMLVPPPMGDGIVTRVAWLRAQRAKEGLRDTESAVFEGVDTLWSDDEEEEEEEESFAAAAVTQLGTPQERREKKEAEDRANGARRQGVEQFKKGDFQRAIHHFDYMAKNTPDDPRAHLNRAAVLLKLKRTREAVLAADRALWLTNGESGKAWYRRALAFKEAGEFNEALADIDAARVREPADKEIKKLREQMKEEQETCTWAFSSECKKLSEEEREGGGGGTPAALMCQVEVFAGEGQPRSLGPLPPPPLA